MYNKTAYQPRVALLVRAPQKYQPKTWLIRNGNKMMMEMMAAFNMFLVSFNQLRHLKSIEMRTNECVKWGDFVLGKKIRANILNPDERANT